MKKKITQHYIARELGVSIGTVDRALHDRPGVNPKTKQKIIDFAQKNAYKPNRIASTLAKISKTLRIGVILQSEPAFYWEKMKQGVMAAERDLYDFGIEIILRELSQIRNTDEILHMLDELVGCSVDAVMLVPVNDSRLRIKIDQLAECGIKIITLNDDINQSKRIFYVGPQMRKSGRVAGELMGRYLNGQGNVVVINGSIESIDYQERIEGFKDVLCEHYPDIRVMATFSYNFEDLKNNLEQVVHGVLESVENITSNNITGIYDADGATLFNIGDYVSSHHMEGRFIIIGHEIWDAVAKLIADEIIHVCISQDPYTQGYEATKLLFQYLISGVKPVHDQLFTRIDVIIKENLTAQDNILNPFSISQV